MQNTSPRFLDVHPDSSRPRGVSFQQHRVELYLRVLGGFFAFFLLLGGVKYAAMIGTGHAEWAEQTRTGAFVFTGVFAIVIALWLFVRRQRRSIDALNTVDSAGTVVTCGAFTSMVPMMPTGTGEPIIAFGLILILVVRAGIVPSTGRRTLLVGLFATAPLALSLWLRGIDADPVTQPTAYFGGLIITIWGTIFAIATRLISRVIYGLRSQLQTLGSYRLVEKLGSGGMGDVWRAEHGMLARPAAIKMIRAQALLGTDDSSSGLERFEKEAQTTAALTCPNTIHLYDFGRAEDGSFYYVMELLDGIDLEALVKDHGPQPAARVSFILQQAARSLIEAHDVGLVHRDIKPANIFLCRYGAEVDFVKVLDFGLVKRHSEPVDVGITRDGLAVGTPAYMAPEMILGETELDGRTDLYALGCVGYWLLTGDLVFKAETPTALLVKHANEEPEPPSQRSELDIPAGLEQIIMACLSKQPDARPASALELRRQLDALALDWPDEEATGWWRLHHPG